MALPRLLSADRTSLWRERPTFLFFLGGMFGCLGIVKGIGFLPDRANLVGPPMLLTGLMFYEILCDSALRTLASPSGGAARAPPPQPTVRRRSGRGSWDWTGDAAFGDRVDGRCGSRFLKRPIVARRGNLSVKGKAESFFR